MKPGRRGQEELSHLNTETWQLTNVSIFSYTCDFQPLQPWDFPATLKPASAQTGFSSNRLQLKPASAKSDTFISWVFKNRTSPTACSGWSIRMQDRRPPPCLQEGLNMQFKGAAVLVLSRSQNPESSKWNFLISRQFTFASNTATMKPHDSLLRMFHVTSPWSGFHFGYVRLPSFALVTEI